jgi:hypothetical protein
MSNLLFFSRSCAYGHAARTELHNARLLPRGSERNQARKRARALRDLARNEAWPPGATLKLSIASAGSHQNVCCCCGNGKRRHLDAASTRRALIALVQLLFQVLNQAIESFRGGRHDKKRPQRGGSAPGP